MRNQLKSALLQSVAGAVLALSFVTVANAQEAQPAPAQESDAEADKSPVPAEKVVVTGTVFRNRSNDTAPTLKYGLDYFQKFEPLTVGDALKRTPSVTFQSDILEADGVRLRGLDPGYTQVLINGEKVPGADVDRSFWVDRIPAELIEGVEIVRSASADRSGDALAGAINIILRDAYTLDGGYIKVGGLRFDDAELKPSLGAVYGGAIGEGRFLVGGNLQGRHNPKNKWSYRYEPDSGVLEFDNSEYQSDVRDGTDYSLNAAITHPFFGGEIELSGNYVLTDRTEVEHSFTFDDNGDPDGTEDQYEDIKQENYALRAKVDLPLFGGTTKIKLGYAEFKEDTTADAYEDGIFDDTEVVDVKDDEISFTLAQVYDFENFTLKFGADLQKKTRDDVEEEVKIEEERFDPYALVRGTAGIVDWEAGLRYETTSADFVHEGVPSDTEYDFLLPSAHALLHVTEDDRIRASFARTVRRPNFDKLSPAMEEDEPIDDQNLQGNPDLQPESAYGFDVGYEHRIGRRGVIGVNVFYRDVKDRIEMVNTGAFDLPDPPGNGFPIYTWDNIGDGSVWGIEFDLSTPLTFVGLDNTGVFLNYSWLDSEITDPVTGESRRFNDQAKYVFNVGFIQDLPSWAAAFGVTYRKQGEQYNQVFGENVKTTYGGDLEAFIEKRITEKFVIRLVGSNLLNSSKDEIFNKWDTLADQLSGDIDDLDEYEVESEVSGPVFQLVGRYAF